MLYHILICITKYYFILFYFVPCCSIMFEIWILNHSKRSSFLIGSLFAWAGGWWRIDWTSSSLLGRRQPTVTSLLLQHFPLLNYRMPVFHGPKIPFLLRWLMTSLMLEALWMNGWTWFSLLKSISSFYTYTYMIEFRWEWKLIVRRVIRDLHRWINLIEDQH